MKATLFAIRFFSLSTFAAQSTPSNGVPITSESKSLYARVNGVSINYLDWGGTGSPLVMIHGLGDSPHIFDDLAPLLRDRFHVYAYARRGHGHSDSPDGPYDLATLVEDLRQLLDKLGLKRTSLLGWSMGGNEITEFAGLYPNRVEKLIYLEAGYEMADPEFLKAFEGTIAALGPDTSTLLSLDAFRGWYQTTALGKDTPWTPGLENYLRDITRVDADGKVKVVPNEKTYMKLFASLASSPRNYTKVKAPSLVLYASEFFPPEPATLPLIRRCATSSKKRCCSGRRKWNAFSGSSRTLPLGNYPRGHICRSECAARTHLLQSSANSSWQTRCSDVAFRFPELARLLVRFDLFASRIVDSDISDAFANTMD